MPPSALSRNSRYSNSPKRVSACFVVKFTIKKLQIKKEFDKISLLNFFCGHPYYPEFDSLLGSGISLELA